MRLDKRHAALAVLVLVVALLAAWRLTLVGLGPDPDSDAYGHHVIARQILVNPHDLSVHWVWLPLFHYGQSLLVLLGGTMTTVRFVNVAVWCAVPFLLFSYLGRGPGAFIAAIVCAACPIGMQMATTAQPEPLFCLLVLASIVAFDARKYILSAVFLAAAAMLRYEAWAVVPAMAVVVLLGRFDKTRPAAGPHPRSAWLVVALPAAAIFAWAAARHAVEGGHWFAFVTQTRDFANDALKTKSSLDGGASMLVGDLLFYSVRVPWHVFGWILLLAPFGLVRTVKRHGATFLLASLACLGFLELSWIMRSTLGLFRHFVVMVPFYSALIGYGTCELGDLFARAFFKRGHVAAAVTTALVAVLGLAGLAAHLDDWMHEWGGALLRGWPDREAVGAYLRSLPPTSTIFCDEGTIEVLSRLDRHRFNRHWVDEPGGTERIEAVADHDGSVYVATWIRKLTELRASGRGEIVFRPPGETSDDAGIAVMRIDRHP
jgi:hypothetical protein